MARPPQSGMTLLFPISPEFEDSEENRHNVIWAVCHNSYSWNKLLWAYLGLCFFSWLKNTWNCVTRWGTSRVMRRQCLWGWRSQISEGFSIVDTINFSWHSSAPGTILQLSGAQIFFGTFLHLERLKVKYVFLQVPCCHFFLKLITVMIII